MKAVDKAIVFALKDLPDVIEAHLSTYSAFKAQHGILETIVSGITC